MRNCVCTLWSVILVFILIKTLTTFSWANKQFATRVYTLFYINRTHWHIISTNKAEWVTHYFAISILAKQRMMVLDKLFSMNADWYCQTFHDSVKSFFAVVTVRKRRKQCWKWALKMEPQDNSIEFPISGYWKADILGPFLCANVSA